MTTTTKTPSTTAVCTSCHAAILPPSFFGRLFHGSTPPACLLPAHGGCGQPLCDKCATTYAVVTEDDAAASTNKLPKVTSGLCKTCFQRHSSVDFSMGEDELGPPRGTAPTLVYVHGGGGNRLMFRAHALAMLAKGNVRCVLLDLPGHGARMDEPLSLASAMATVVAVTQEKAPPCRQTGTKPIYIGGSLGGYIGMELIGQYPDLYSAAVIAMCGQNVGVGASLVARLGLRAMEAWIPQLSGQCDTILIDPPTSPSMNLESFSRLGWLMPGVPIHPPTHPPTGATMLTGLVREVSKNKYIPTHVLLDTLYRTGTFFTQAREQIAVLRASNPPSSLPLFPGPVLFVNGSKDHR